jgi:hypothetical protein
MKRSNEFIDITLKAIHCLTEFAVVDLYLGAGLEVLMGRWMQAVGPGA